ncbi:MAG: SAM-dependent DNA methyltransferase [Nitrosomonadales bacterium]|nr:SAM-dependent DNA methyltransferase [Nitrosomonadales bacterium]
MNKKLGQFMTPSGIAGLVARELGYCDTVIDFAVGEGALLNAVQHMQGNGTGVIGFDVDQKMINRAQMVLRNAQLIYGNGLTSHIKGEPRGKIGIVGNPPFVSAAPVESSWVTKAFPGLTGKLGTHRAEVQFLARALVTARPVGGRVVFVMPIGFADGDIYSRIRALLTSQYRLLKCIEVPAGIFADTEARTVVLVIDTAGEGGIETEVCEVQAYSAQPLRVVSKVIKPGERLDARYHKAMQSSTSNGPLLRDLGVTIDRGIYSRKEAEDMHITAIHTSDLNRATNHKLVGSPGKNETLGHAVTAKKGDILLPRTGSRVRWEPVIVQSGEMPITDHVFRIRAPKKVREIVCQSFYHPLFRAWLEGASKGVCATVLTKRELLQMPAFAFSYSAEELLSTTS